MTTVKSQLSNNKNSEQQQPLFQKRQQFYRNPYTLLSYKLESNSGISTQVDDLGGKIKNYNVNITGKANHQKRNEYAKKFGHEFLVTNISQDISESNLLPVVLKEMNSSHFIPRVSSRDYLESKTRRRDILKGMISLNSSSYGNLPSESPRINRPQTHNTQRVNTMQMKSSGNRSFSGVKNQRSDHIIVMSSTSQTKSPSPSPDVRTQKDLSFTKHQVQSSKGVSQIGSCIFKSQADVNKDYNSSLNFSRMQQVSQTSKAEKQSYESLKAVEITRSLVSNYQSIQKSDVRNSQIKGYLDSGRQSYNDWETYFQAKKSAATLVAHSEQQKAKLGTQQKGTKQAEETLNTITSSSVQNSARAQITEKQSTPVAIKINKKCRLDDRLAASLFIEQAEFTNKELQQNNETDLEHDYPFQGTKHFNQVSINEDQVRLSLRTKFDFDVVDKLSNPNQIPKKSKSNYEIYEEYRNKNTASKTKGYYQSDAEQVIKNPGDFQQDDYKALLKQNPALRSNFDKQLKADKKKFAILYYFKANQEKEIRRSMAQKDRQFIQNVQKKQLATWQSSPKH